MEKPQDRRGGRRVACFLEGTCETIEGTPPALVSSAITVLNLSLTGANLSASRAFERRSMFYLKLPNPARTFWCGRLTNVVYARSLPPNHWHLGCEFTTPLSENELHTLLGHSSAPERRRHPRYVLSHETTDHLTVTLKDQEGSATIQDMSLGGVSLTVTRAIEKGAHFQAEFHNTASGVRRVVTLETLHVRQLGALWCVGCAFPEKMNAHELLGLLA